MRVIRAFLVIALVLDVAYWTVWFADREAIASLHTQAYYDFENAFPLADLWLGIACLMALLTMGRRPSGLFWLICAGGAGLYLGCMDLLYDVEHGVFWASGGGIVEAVIVVLTWVFSLSVLRWSWAHRGELLQPPSR